MKPPDKDHPPMGDPFGPFPPGDAAPPEEPHEAPSSGGAPDDPPPEAPHQDHAPSHGTPPYGAPPYWAPPYGAPHYWPSPFGAPLYGAPPYGSFFTWPGGTSSGSPFQPVHPPQHQAAQTTADSASDTKPQPIATLAEALDALAGPLGRVIQAVNPQVATDRERALRNLDLQERELTLRARLTSHTLLFNGLLVVAALVASGGMLWWAWIARNAGFTEASQLPTMVAGLLFGFLTGRLSGGWPPKA